MAEVDIGFDMLLLPQSQKSADVSTSWKGHKDKDKDNIITNTIFVSANRNLVCACREGPLYFTVAK